DVGSSGGGAGRVEADGVAVGWPWLAGVSGCLSVLVDESAAGGVSSDRPAGPIRDDLRHGLVRVDRACGGAAGLGIEPVRIIRGCSELLVRRSYQRVWFARAARATNPITSLESPAQRARTSLRHPQVRQVQVRVRSWMWRRPGG